jgi:hypothetical protein
LVFAFLPSLTPLSLILFLQNMMIGATIMLMPSGRDVTLREAAGMPFAVRCRAAGVFMILEGGSSRSAGASLEIYGISAVIMIIREDTSP